MTCMDSIAVTSSGQLRGTTADGITAAAVGEVVTTDSLGGARYAEGALR